MGNFTKMWWFLTLTMLMVMIKGDDSISCDADNQCPEDAPCCSQYGVCGTGAYCLGGCDIRYSYNLTACMPMPKIDKYEDAFSSKDLFLKQEEYLGNYSETDWVYTGYLDTNDDAVLLQMPNQSTGTVISSTKYVWYGKVSASVKSSHDRGVITAFILFSDVQDEIDYEFIGYNLTNPQTNYYSQGILNYTNSKNSSVSDTFENWHDYELDWKEDRIDWSIDGVNVRTLFKNSTYNETTKNYDYPQTPSRIQFSLWPGGDSRNGLGTIEWAGGAIDWDSDDIQKYGYYYAYVKNVTISPYDTPDFVEEVRDDDVDSDSFNAYLYNSTDGTEYNIYLTNKKTWLGSGDATGLDPDNDSESAGVVETTVVSGSGSSKTTQTKTATKATVNVPDLATKTTSTANDYNPSDGIGGFVQDSNTSSTSSSNGGSSNRGNHYYSEGFIGILSAMSLGFFSIFI